MLRRNGFAISISSGVIVAKAEDTVYSVAKLMKRYNIGAVVILKNEKIIGIVSERDIVKKVVCGNRVPQKVKVKEIMVKKVVTADIKKGLSRIYEIMCEAPFRHLPIVSKGRLIGIVSNRNLISAVSSKF